jgi:hypothetical protein
MRFAALRARTGRFAVLVCLRAWIQVDFPEHRPAMCAEPQRFHPARRTADSPMRSANHVRVIEVDNP